MLVTGAMLSLSTGKRLSSPLSGSVWKGVNYISRTKKEAKEIEAFFDDKFSISVTINGHVATQSYGSEHELKKAMMFENPLRKLAHQARVIPEHWKKKGGK